MYPISVYPGSVYPGPIFPGTGKPLIPPLVGLVGVWPSAIYPASLFPGSVYPHELIAAPLADDLVDAIFARVQAQLVDAGYLTWFGTGRTDHPLPYAVLQEPDEDDSYWTTQGDAQADGHLEITCYASTKKAARALGNALFDVLQDAPLVFAAGELVYLRQSGRTAALDPDPGPGGVDVWGEVRQFHFIYDF